MIMIANNMFSMFDPSSSYISANWIIILWPIIIINNTICNKITNIVCIINTMLIFVSNEINQIVENKLNLTNPTFISLFILLFIFNILAIFPFNFTPTAHISISFSLSSTLWISTIIFGWKNQFSAIIVHLTPLGTPNPLINFIVVIEIISSIIRPITLSIRLSANIVAGHLLISLLSSFSINNTIYASYSTVPIALLILLEIAVALVQAYVIITLMLLYQNETSQ